MTYSWQQFPDNRAPGDTVSLRPLSPPSATAWKDLYITVLHESDERKVPPLIAQAECAIVKRTWELFRSAGDPLQERDALDVAYCALQALRV